MLTHKTVALALGYTESEIEDARKKKAQWVQFTTNMNALMKEIKKRKVGFQMFSDLDNGEMVFQAHVYSLEFVLGGQVFFGKDECMVLAQALVSYVKHKALEDRKQNNYERR